MTTNRFDTHGHGRFPKKAQGYYTRWAMRPADRKALTDRLFADYVDTYESWLQQQSDALKLGQAVELSDKGVLRSLKARAGRDAAGVVRTYNRELKNKIINLHREDDGSLSDTSLERWWVDRDVVKAEQIALMTEMNGQGLAARDFLARNKARLGGTATVTPNDASEPLCAALLGKTYSFAEARQIILPLHVNCVHGWAMEYDTIPEGAGGMLWLGQGKQ